MPFFSNWGRVLHVLVHMLLTRVTRVPMNQRQVIPVVCDQSAHSKWRRCEGRTKWVSSLSLGLPMQLANRVLSIVGFVERMSRCWRMAFMRSFDTIRGVKHFARDQRLRLETPGWRVLDFEGNPLSESELERRKEHILRGPLVVRDRECPFAEDLIVDECGVLGATLPLVAKLSSLIEVLRLGGPYESVSQLWSQFTLIASRVNIDVAWYRDEVLVGIVLLLVATCTCSLAYWCCVLVNHLEGNVPLHSCSCFCLAKGSWEVQHRVRGTRFRDLGHGADMGEVHISTCLRCRAEPV